MADPGHKVFSRSDSAASVLLNIGNVVPDDDSFERTPPAGTAVVEDNGDGTGTIHIRMDDGTWGTVAIV